MSITINRDLKPFVTATLDSYLKITKDVKNCRANVDCDTFYALKKAIQIFSTTFHDYDSKKMDTLNRRLFKAEWLQFKKGLKLDLSVQNLIEKGLKIIDEEDYIGLVSKIDEMQKSVQYTKYELDGLKWIQGIALKHL
ncbi:MAG: hypothetical protein JHC93_07430 [Parachlamydiales bacterium]|nr:hypothetical protein [Parachlamydiales bacterium]